MKVEVEAGMKIAKLRSVIDVKEQVEIFDKEEIDVTMEEAEKTVEQGSLTRKEKDEMKKLIIQLKDIFRKQVNAHTTINNKLAPINLELKEGTKPVVLNMGRINPEREKIVEEKVNELNERGLIEEGTGEWRSRMVLVKKPDGSWRTCIDYRKLNEALIPDSYPMPRIDEILDKLKGAKYFSKIDLTEGFYQVSLNERSAEMTGFATRSRYWRWRVLPMGLKVSPGKFQRRMDKVFGSLKWNGVMGYIDDFIIYSNTFEEHMELLKRVFEKLKDHGIFAKISKCQFGLEEIEFLGHVVSKEGMKANGKKVKAIRDGKTKR